MSVPGLAHHRALLAAAWLAYAGPLAPATRAQAQAPRAETCAACHRGLADERLASPARTFGSDVHAENGLGCLACHGRAAGAHATTGFLSKPQRQEVPRLCGRCHSDAAYMRRFNPSLRVDQVSEYFSSVHGQRLMQLGDPDVAICTDCHHAHEIRPPSDPQSSVYPLNVAETCGRCHADARYMAGHDVPTDQLHEYRSSVHGRLMFEEEDLSAPTCNDCHGNHGAAPPGIGSIRNVCGQCHSTMADSFAQSRHADVFEREGLPGCATCHANHAVQPASDENLPERAADVCGRCHTPTDRHGREFRTIRELLDSLKMELQRSRAILLGAANAGMEVSQAQFELEEVNNALTMARSAVHSFQVEPVKAHVDQGLALTDAGAQRGRAALDEHTFRRVGLAASAAIVLALITGLLLKIRQLERRTGPDAPVTDSQEHDHA